MQELRTGGRSGPYICCASASSEARWNLILREVRVDLATPPAASRVGFDRPERAVLLSRVAVPALRTTCCMREPKVCRSRELSQLLMPAQPLEQCHPLQWLAMLVAMEKPASPVRGEQSASRSSQPSTAWISLPIGHLECDCAEHGACSPRPCLGRFRWSQPGTPEQTRRPRTPTRHAPNHTIASICPVDVEARTLVRTGAWISVLYKAFTPYDQSAPAFDPYEASILAAKAAILLSSIRSLPTVTGKQFDVYSKLARLKPRETTETVLKVLQDIVKDLARKLRRYINAYQPMPNRFSGNIPIQPPHS
jgi:hypothetical protein